MSVLVQATVRDKTDQTTVRASESDMPNLGEHEEVPTKANTATVEDFFESATDATATAVTPDILKATNTGSGMPNLREHKEAPTEANAATVEDSFEPATEATATAVTHDMPNATNTYYCVYILQMIQ